METSIERIEGRHKGSYQQYSHNKQYQQKGQTNRPAAFEMTFSRMEGKHFCLFSQIIGINLRHQPGSAYDVMMSANGLLICRHGGIPGLSLFADEKCLFADKPDHSPRTAGKSGGQMLDLKHEKQVALIVCKFCGLLLHDPDSL